ncbi:PIR protein CIR protein [Plasmodium vinckei vinckei]|uniref:PIR protein CIR protein n=1 Tax=Plasmodium vinckei vinckei TaxID=54757 RepID=A0A449BMS2_PLAVN|nr:PIR protein CIR protein [Plasmodium vinckei vinckei]VEV54724.1 PIR protein CIR protein [Plasmodium vinckei vinckei]
MAGSSDNLKDLYSLFNDIDGYFWEDDSGKLKVDPKYESIHNYCHYGSNSEENKCNDYLQLATCSVIYLLKNLKNYGLEYDKFAEYAILWLSYKLDIKINNEFTNLNEFYTKYIENNNCYNDKIKGDDGMTYKKIIDTNKDLMDMDIKEISKFNYPFNILVHLYYKCHHEYWDCQKNLGFAKSFAEEFEKLNDDPKNTENSLYSQILSTLSDDYKKLKKIYYDKNQSCKFPDLPILKHPKSSVKNSLESSENLSAVSSENLSAVSSENISAVNSEATSSSSSIASKLIPSLLIFGIPVFFGISYKTIYKKKIKNNKEENET